MPGILYLFNVLLLSKEIAGRVWTVKINGYKLVTTARIPVSIKTLYYPTDAQRYNS